MDSRLIKRIVLLVILPVVLIVGGFMAYRYFFTFYISSVNPDSSSMSYLTPSVKISFNKAFDKNKLSVIDDSAMIEKDSTEYTSNSVKFYLRTSKLEVGKSFSFDVSVVSKDGYELKQNLTFTPKDIDFNSLPGDQQKEIKRLESKRPAYYSDPVLSLLPYSTLDYKMEPNFIDNGFIINTTVYVSDIDKANEQQVIQQRYEKAIKYIRSKGIDTKKYIFKLIVVGT